MELIDDEYIAEANPQNIKRKQPKRRSRLFILAATLTLLLTTVGLWLFIPFRTEPPDVSRYADSEYYSIIQKLNTLTFKAPRYKNNFDKLLSTGFGLFERKNDAMGSAPGMNASTDAATYQEVTDNQVTGVIEADLIKRSDKHIFHLFDGTLYVYSIDGMDSKQVGSYNFPSEVLDRYRYVSEWEFYLSADCKSVTVIAPFINQKGSAEIRLISLDVSDPTNIRKKKSVTVSGSYLSSRMVNGKMLLISSFHVESDVDFSDESTFVPQIDCGNGAESIPMSDIISPETLTSPRYTVVCKLDENSLDLEGSSAFLSYSEEVYVSADNIYVTRSYSDKQEESSGYVLTTAMTEISALAYSDDHFEHLGSISLEGSVKDQYSLDEYDRLLRVVTTTSVSSRKETNDSMTVFSPSATSASLYCVDLASWKIVAKVEDFAPIGEVVQSVRFDRENAYVCTSVQLTDPVFFFDLSDLNNITYKDTGTIDGFSSSLVNFGDGYLLGIGVGSSTDTVKVEIYEETENGVRSVCKYEIEHAYISSDYKSYYIDRENRLIGFGLTLEPYYNSHSENERYLLLTFDDYNLHALVDTPLGGENTYKRGVYIDEYFYMFGSEGIKVSHIG